MKKKNDVHLTLASQSKRRRVLLTSLGIAFQCWTPSGEEHSTKEAGAHHAREIARNKAEEALSVVNTRLILAADTLIEVDHNILGKPKHIDDARNMLMLLAGREHYVHTAICLYDRQQQEWIEKGARSTVHFHPLTASELNWLIAAEEWKDAAGAYMIQGRAACFIKNIEGSYSNIMGLPIRLLYSILSAYECLF